MALRAAIPLVVLIAFAALPLAFPYNPASLPTRHPEAAVPLLKKFSPEAGYARIVEILGKPDLRVGNYSYFRMDDDLNIRVTMFDDGYIFEIEREDAATGL